MAETFTVAVAQVAPAFLDLDRSLAIAEKWIADAGQQGVRVLAFPETWLPGYPFWLDVSPGAAMWDHPPAKALFRRLVEHSVEVPSAVTARLGAAAREAGLTLIMGINERDGGTLYNTILYIGESGDLLGKHRKLVPTYTERLVWGRGDGSTLDAVQTPVGTVGALVCWEHWMPLARYAMHRQRETVHAALWPTVKEMHLLASRTYAFEGRCYVLAAGFTLSRAHLPAGCDLLDALPDDGPWLAGGSAIIGPDGMLLAGPVGAEETLLLAEVDPARITEERMTLDVCGHYARPDVFQLHIDDTPHAP